MEENNYTSPCVEIVSLCSENAILQTSQDRGEEGQFEPGGDLS